VQNIAMSSTSINELIEPLCTFKSDEPFSAIMGIRPVVNDVLPKDWAMLTDAGGKIFMLNLSNGKSFMLPADRLCFQAFKRFE
jgi:hypothetical protein